MPQNVPDEIIASAKPLAVFDPEWKAILLFAGYPSGGNKVMGRTLDDGLGALPEIGR